MALDLGGRLLSLYDRRADRQLLYSNPVVQPANLALRNAWFSGGVEWNIGTRGHSPTTMDTLHAAIVEGPGGDPVLRLWEWERIRGVVFQIDLWMPSSSAVLLARTRIRNVNDMATPMYWWTNAAITVSADTRVIAPATRAFRTEYPSGLRVTGVPDDGDGDVTFPASQAKAADFFFDVAAQQRPWIVAVGGDGAGTRSRLDRCITWPQVVRLGHWPRRTPVAAVAVPRWRRRCTPRSREAWRPPSSST